MYPTNIVQATIYQFLGNVITSSNNSTQPTSCELQELIPDTTANTLNLKHVSNEGVHPITGKKITKYTKLANNPIAKETWQKAFCVELSHLTERYSNTLVTNTVKFMDYDTIKGIPLNQIVTYARIVVDYQAQK